MKKEDIFTDSRWLRKKNRFCFRSFLSSTFFSRNSKKYKTRLSAQHGEWAVFYLNGNWIDKNVNDGEGGKLKLILQKWENVKIKCIFECLCVQV